MSTKILLLSSVLSASSLFLAVGLCFADASTETVRAAAPNPSGLLAHYQFEGDSVDTAGLQPPADCVILGNPTYCPGVFGLALSLDGDGDYVDCGNGLFFNITDRLTVTAWIKVGQFDKQYQTIISKGDNSWRLARAGKSNRIEFACNGTAANKWNGTGEVPWAVTGITDVNDGKWHHIAGVFDGSGMYLYVDGMLEAAKAAKKSIDVSNYNMFTGANAQVPGRDWNGLIDDVRIYNYALSQAEIVAVIGKTEITLPEPVPATLFNIAKRYDGLKKREEAKGVCRVILQNYPESPYASSAQIYISKRNIISLIESKDYDGAQTQLDTLIADFNDQPDTAEALYAVAQAYSPPRKFKEAEDVYRRLLQLFPDSSYATEALFRSPKLHIFYLIQTGKNSEAMSAIDKFTADFAGHPALTGIIFWFAKEFEASKAYEQAKSIYQRVAWQYPGSSHASMSWIGFYRVEAISLIEAGDNTAVQKILDNLIADFNDHPDLPDSVLILGEEYYKRAYRLESEGNHQQAKEFFRKAIFIFEQITKQFPGSAHSEYAGHLIVDCLSRFGDKYCGAYVVWHTLHYYGLTRPIDVIAGEMQIERKGSVSIYEIVHTLKANEISAHSVKLDLEKLSAIDKPFVQYIAPAKNSQFGHFRLCIPDGSGKAVILDGAEEPKVFDLSYSEDYDYQGTKWDGTSILIDVVIKGISNDEVSQLLTLDGMLLLAANWLEAGCNSYSGDDFAVDSHLSLDLQLSLRGGWGDWDCKGVGENCLDRPACSSHEECYHLVGTYGCGDITEEEKCVLTQVGWIPCRYDPSRNCAPKRRYNGECNNGRCGFLTANYGDCAGNRWLYQCHDGW